MLCAYRQKSTLKSILEELNEKKSDSKDDVEMSWASENASDE